MMTACITVCYLAAIEKDPGFTAAFANQAARPGYFTAYVHGNLIGFHVF